MSNHDNTPVIIGVGQQTWREADVGRTPLDALFSVADLAVADSHCSKLVHSIDTVATVRFISDTNAAMRTLLPRNPARHIASHLGLANAALLQGTIGGNTPQYLVNHFADALSRGEHSAVLLCGTELLATLFSALRNGDDISAWAGTPDEEPQTIGTERDGVTDTERRHGLYEPINTYPLFENSLRHHLGSTFTDHQAHIAAICSAMSQVASKNPQAWRQQALSAQEIASTDHGNRYIGYPYTKSMNALLAVDMAAAIIITTAGKARELGIDPQRLIYLRGGTSVNDIWHVSERPALHQSPAIGLAWQNLTEATGIAVDELTDFDIYSCFPSAVQIACAEIGISPLDPRGVTVTGGLPYFGGPGNNYSLHAIVDMVARLRDRGQGHGLVTANGLYLTKHALGVYSTEPGTWSCPDSSRLQAAIDVQPKLPVAKDPCGNATVETYTVGFGREGPKRGIVIARNDRGERVVANTATDERALQQLIDHDPVGQTGRIQVRDGINSIEF